MHFVARAAVAEPECVSEGGNTTLGRRIGGEGRGQINEGKHSLSGTRCDGMGSIGGPDEDLREQTVDGCWMEVSEESEHHLTLREHETDL